MTTTDHQIEVFELDDAGNGDRFAKVYGETARFCHEARTWHVWDGRVWAPDETELTIAMAMNVASQIENEVRADDDEVRAKAVRAWRKASRSIGKAKSMLEAARAKPEMVVRIADLDPDAMLLNTPDGVIDLGAGGEVLDHDPAFMQSRITGVAFERGARSDLWDACLLAWFPDAEMRAYVQKVIGASILGRQTEKVFIHNGTGANGKSKMLDAVVRVLGTYATVSRAELVTGRRGRDSGAATPEVMRLRGYRFVYLDETPERAVLDEARVKALSGGSEVSGRQIFERETTFRPIFDLHVATNHLPAVNDLTESIWRRLGPIPWNQTIPEEDRDLELAQKLANPENMTAIFAWLVEGCLAFLRDGFDPVPAEVTTALNFYREGEDVLARWFADWVTLDPNHNAKAKDLYESFSRFANEDGSDRKMSAVAFGIALTRHLQNNGFDPEKSQVGTGRLTAYEGIRLWGENA